MKKIKETYSLFIEPGFIEDYLPNVELPSPHLQFEHIIPASCFEGYKEFSSKEEEEKFLKNAREQEIHNISSYSFDSMFSTSSVAFEKLYDLFKNYDIEELDTVLSYEDIYFDESKSSVELEFVE